MIFISHLHGDHYLGLMGLLFSMHLLKRTTDIHLYGPPGLDEIILVQLKYSRSSLNFNINFHPIDTAKPCVLFQNDSLHIQSIPLTHKIPCTGFIFREQPKPRRINKEKLPQGILLQHIATLKQGKNVLDENGKILYYNEELTLPPRPSFSYAYCSDTSFNEHLVELLTNIDMLYHEATFMEEHSDKATETLHSTARQAARIAKSANVKKLLLGHFSARYKDLEPLLDEARVEFSNTALAIEGETFDLDY